MNQTPLNHRARSSILRSLACLLGLSALLSITACDANQHMSAQQRADAEREQRQEVVRQQLERRYMIGPTSAAKIDYAVQWQFQVPQRRVKQIIPADDSIFILTHNNDLIRIMSNDGRRVWTVSVAKSLQKVHSIIPVKEQGLVLVLTDNSILTLSLATGMAEAAVIGKAKQNLEWIANTECSVSGEYLLYGAPSGQLVWQAWQIGFAWRAYQIDHTVRLKPTVQNNIVVATGSSGVILAFDVRTASQIWRTELLDNIVAEPAVSSSAIYIAGLDQHLRAFDLSTGRRLWRVLTTSPLTDSPVLIGNTVYQQIPSEGLAFTALPNNMLNGERRWTCDSIAGSVITKRNNTLITWDARTKLLSTIASDRGTPGTQLHLPDVSNVTSTNTEEGTLYILGIDGRMTCLAPTN
jgi:outer membrane protein assembly factor BamB